MNVRVVRGDERFIVHHAEGCPQSLVTNTANTVRVELAEEEIISKRRSELTATVTHQTGGGNVTTATEGGERVARSDDSRQARRLEVVDPALDPVQQRIVAALIVIED